MTKDENHWPFSRKLVYRDSIVIKKYNGYTVFIKQNCFVSFCDKSEVSVKWNEQNPPNGKGVNQMHVSLAYYHQHNVMHIILRTYVTMHNFSDTTMIVIITIVGSILTVLQQIRNSFRWFLIIEFG